MATVVLQYVGATLGTFLGGPVGGIIGRAVGAVAGNMLDQSLFGGGTKRIEGPRLSDTRVMASTEGAPVPRLWGRARLAGQMIWATSLEEVTETSTDKAGGKGGPKTEHVTYAYFANIALALCEGPVARIGRVWADGKEVDISDFHWRLHRGSETQAPDSLITAKEGEGKAPAYRGIAYVVFERLPLADFGNRIPQLSFEVFKPAGGAESHVRAVNIIPGSTEFGYDPTVITETLGDDETRIVNSVSSSNESDWTVSIDDLTATCRNLGSASLVVAWFGNDLRCGSCRIKPGVEVNDKTTEPESWSVAGLARNAAHVVSLHAGSPAYGGTPSDRSVIRALRDLAARGLKPVFYPFILMDIADGNGLPDPYGGSTQPAYPWRGRITCDPAPGRPSTADKSADCTAQLAQFMGSASPGDFTINGENVTYTGSADWGYRRLVLHYAHLCKIAGGVDAFLIGSELPGLTRLRGTANSFPFVQALCDLAAEVKAILPGAKVSYAADWSEYFGHQPADGSGDVFFHLDPLWSSSDIDFIGIDNYMPLTDWRDGNQHLDRLAGARSIYDLDYLKSRIAGGEGFDWYYASQAGRDSQTRTAITDGAYGKPWVYRYKDLVSWWSNRHYDRPGGSQSAAHTGWVPQSKPIWLTETGCAAIDKGTNQPNKFLDPKSSESDAPHYSRGARDDFLQTRFIMAVDDYWSETGAHNPVSSVYGGRMLDPDRIYHWAWDARPFPSFPLRRDVWSDGDNYDRGHWLNGRIGAVPLSALLARICSDYGIDSPSLASVEGQVDGFVIDRVMSGREALEALSGAFSIDVVETGTTIAFRSRRAAQRLAVAADALVESDPGAALLSLTRAQEIDLPRVLKLSFIESGLDYRRAAVEALRGSGGSAREALVDLPCVIAHEAAQLRADIALQERWAGRETLEVSLPPRFARLEPGDVIDIDLPQGTRAFRIDSLADGEYRKLRARSYEPALYEAAPGSDGRRPRLPPLRLPGRPDLLFLDLPLAETGTRPAVPWVAVSAKPWVGAVALSRYVSTTATAFNRNLEHRATKGRLTTSLAAGPLDCFDRANAVTVKLDFGALRSVDEEELLQGANLAAIGSAATGWEIIQFGAAELVAAATYRLSHLLRGQLGSDPEMLALRDAGSRFVLLNAAVVQPVLAADQGGLSLRWKATPRKLISTANTRLLTHEGKRLGLRPRAPCQLRLGREGGDLVFTWIRRTRVDGDSWEAAEVPLSEQSEAYAVEVLDGAVVRRAATVTEPVYRYTSTDQSADFPAGPADFAIRISQLSAAYGRGAPLLRTIHV